MNTPSNSPESTYDVVILGAGAGGMSTAIVAAQHGLKVAILEKSPYFGGTTAFSGGVLWIPGNSLGQASGVSDSRDKVETYLRHELGNGYDAEMIKVFLDKAPEMVDYFSEHTAVKFVPTLYPDYHPDAPGGALVGRSILAAPYDIRELGTEMSRLRPPLETITFFGMMFNSSNADIAHFFKVTKSLRSAMYVGRRLLAHGLELLRYRRAVQVTSGNALAARLAKTVLDLGIPIFTKTEVKGLLRDDERVRGVQISTSEGTQEILARVGVVLATGGFAHDPQRTRQAYRHLKSGSEHCSPVPQDNTGDGGRLAETAGGRVELNFVEPAAWMPVSKVPLRGGRVGAFPHLLDRYKPGMIGVNSDGKRFTNESNSYHDVGAAMSRQTQNGMEAVMWLICDHTTIRRYGLGYAKPAPMPLGSLVRSNYLYKAPTLESLAQQIGVPGVNLTQTIADYNRHAEHGEDPAHGRGSTAFNRYLADPAHQPNPCVAPIAKAPFYALKLVMGDLGSFDGIRTDAFGCVLDEAQRPIPGLFAVGNDRASVMAGTYPAAGITLGPIMTFGYVLGLHLAEATSAPTTESLS